MSEKVDQNENLIGSMCIILHRERSFHGIETRTLKSAIQKYARRAMFFPKGIWCLIELDLFSVLETHPELYSHANEKKLTPKQIQMNSTRLRSNMINRLVAMMSEDVGPTDPQLPMKIHQLYLKWIEHRRKDLSREFLIQLYYLLANENIQRIRLLSDLRTVYNLPEYLTKNNNLHRELLEKFHMTELIDILYKKKHPIKKEDLCETVIEHLDKKSELAFAYLSVLFKKDADSLIKDKLWPYILRRSPFSNSTIALAYFYKTLKHKEHYLYLYHAMAFIIYEDLIGKIENKKDDSLKQDTKILYEEHRYPSNTIELDSFIFDRHTGETTSRTEFALEGAQVANECQLLLNEKYREMYLEFKVLIDRDEEQQRGKSKKKPDNKRKITSDEILSTQKKPKLDSSNLLMDSILDEEIVELGYTLMNKSSSFVSDELDHLAHGQRRTGKHKKAVFIDSNEIFKGPYDAAQPGDKKKLLNNLYFTRALLVLENYLNIDEKYRSILDWSGIIRIDTSSEYYLKQKSIGVLTDVEEDYEMVTTKIENDVKVLRRGSHIHRLIELEKDPSKFLNENSDLCQAAVQHFYLRYLLNVGDSGTWNILVRRDGIAGVCGIDFEELRSEKCKTIRDPMVLLFSKISKQQRLLYEPYINKIKIFDEKIDSSSSLAIQLSKSFHLDVEQINERIEHFSKCLILKK